MRDDTGLIDRITRIGDMPGYMNRFVANNADWEPTIDAHDIAQLYWQEVHGEAFWRGTFNVDNNG